MSSLDNPPAPRTRPKDRRAVTVLAASELFYRRGYQRVSVAEIARATNVGSSAIFRHFPRKTDLLLAATRRSLAVLSGILADAMATDEDPADRLPRLFPELARFALDYREAGVLWQREARVLEAPEQGIVREDLWGIARALTVVIRDHRPELSEQDADLLSWCTLGAMVSVGFHSIDLPRERYVELLIELMRALTDLELPASTPAQDAQPGVRVAASEESDPASRRDDLLTIATRMFAERGFDTVSVDDIGTAAGIAGPSIYSHFASKLDLLVATMRRGSELLRTEAVDALVSDGPPVSKLRRLTRSYLEFAMRERFLLRIVLSEVSRLDGADENWARLRQHEYIDTWTDLLLQARGGDAKAARIRVQAVLLVVNDAVQTPHLRVPPRFEESMLLVSSALLGIDGS